MTCPALNSVELAMKECNDTGQNEDLCLWQITFGSKFTYARALALASKTNTSELEEMARALFATHIKYAGGSKIGATERVQFVPANIYESAGRIVDFRQEILPESLRMMMLRSSQRLYRSRPVLMKGSLFLGSLWGSHDLDKTFSQLVRRLARLYRLTALCDDDRRQILERFNSTVDINRDYQLHGTWRVLFYRVPVTDRSDGEEYVWTVDGSEKKGGRLELLRDRCASGREFSPLPTVMVATPRPRRVKIAISPSLPIGRVKRQPEALRAKAALLVLQELGIEI